ncbi:MAG: NAD-dependent protein deacylase [Lachnospiraceae bacterium]|nr:NAD-dependent protein deacylase [Lachnospiraceae bacterium]
MNEFLSASESFSLRFERFKELIDTSKRIVFFGGAGVSTGSGIPDFRGKDGLYNNMPEEYKAYEPEYMLSHTCLYTKPELFFTFYRKVMDVRGYKPNAVHKYLAKLEEQGKVAGVVTQNIDLLHEAAGSRKLFKIHGTVSANHCEKCGKVRGKDFIFDNTDPIPRCVCGGMVRPDVVLYEEPLPQDAYSGAKNAIRSADLMIVCGTSLTVEPAASLVSNYVGENLVIINRQPTKYDQWADIVFHEDMNEIFRKLMAEEKESAYVTKSI